MYKVLQLAVISVLYKNRGSHDLRYDTSVCMCASTC